MPERNLDDLESVIAAILRERFADVDFVSIDLRPEEDEDGVEFLWIDVVFDGGRGALDPAKTSGLVRRLLPRLQEKGETAFPILSFIAASETRKKRPAAA